MKTQKEKEICPDCGANSWSKKEVLKCDDCGGVKTSGEGLPSGTTPRTQGKQSEEAGDVFAREAADEIFGMFSGILHRVVDRIESGLTDGIADECAAVKLEDVLDVITRVKRGGMRPDEVQRVSFKFRDMIDTVVRRSLQAEGLSEDENVAIACAEAFDWFYKNLSVLLTTVGDTQPVESVLPPKAEPIVAESSAADVCKEEGEEGASRRSPDHTR